jgi:NhaA family Na+:H+ antiporter
MSLFIGGLAFPSAELIDEAKLGTLAGSILAALVGYSLLRVAPLDKNHAREEAEQEQEIARDGDIADLCDEVEAKA